MTNTTRAKLTQFVDDAVMLLVPPLILAGLVLVTIGLVGLIVMSTTPPRCVEGVATSPTVATCQSPDARIEMHGDVAICRCPVAGGGE